MQMTEDHKSGNNKKVVTMFWSAMILAVTIMLTFMGGLVIGSNIAYDEIRNNPLKAFPDFNSLTVRLLDDSIAHFDYVAEVDYKKWEPAYIKTATGEELNVRNIIAFNHSAFLPRLRPASDEELNVTLPVEVEEGDKD